MININQVIKIQEKLIDIYGGIKGIRDSNLLESALNRPFTRFGGKDLYKSPIEKASVLLESLIKNHAFLDGNKRTAYVVYRSYLLSNNLDIKASQEEKYNFVICIAEGKIKLTQIIEWTKHHLIKSV